MIENSFATYSVRTLIQSSIFSINLARLRERAKNVVYYSNLASPNNLNGLTVHIDESNEERKERTKGLSFLVILNY